MALTLTLALALTLSVDRGSPYHRACMSTTSDLSTVARYAKSHAPLLFRIRVDSPMELGADIHWLSLFPGEREVLYPPLTYLKPMFRQEIRNVPGTVITLKPSFPT